VTFLNQKLYIPVPMTSLSQTSNLSKAHMTRDSIGDERGRHLHPGLVYVQVRRTKR